MTGIELAHPAAMPAPQGGALPTGLEWAALERMAETLAESGLIPNALRNKPRDVAVILLAAREYGVPPLMALSKLPVVNGTPAPMGELMVALVLRAGHRIRVAVEGEGGPWADTVAVCTTRRRDEDTDDVLRFTFREAVAAKLVDVKDGKPFSRDSRGNAQPWELYTVNMLRWRAVANACRLRFPDVLLGMSYLPEELGAIVDATGAPVEGEVVAPRGAPAGTLEQRTAQESADKLTEQPWADHVLAAVRAHAEAGGYLDVLVTYAEGERMTLREALTRHVEDRSHTDTVDAVIVDDTPEKGPQEAEETSTPAEGPVEAQQAAQEAATPADDAPDPMPVESDLEAAYDLARDALACRDVELIRANYRAAGDLRALDVLAVTGDDDLAALDAPQDLQVMTLGALLMAAGTYVTRHGAAVRDLDDPWADGSASSAPVAPSAAYTAAQAAE